jgi:hypothetical protein
MVCDDGNGGGGATDGEDDSCCGGGWVGKLDISFAFSICLERKSTLRWTAPGRYLLEGVREDIFVGDGVSRESLR